MVRYIERAVKLALADEVAAMVTCPINKGLMRQAGYAYEGHTQLIAHLTGREEFVMMLAGESLRVALVTIHCPLKEVHRILTTKMVYRTIRITHRALQEDFGFPEPRIGVAALNPHGGEGGLFGAEEAEVIQPAVRKAQEEGMPILGPLPADTIFHKASAGGFDAVVAMYHDQGLIPLKLLHFSDAVNITLGLPIIRTSVDHGTAYDIAGTWKANPSSLIQAVRLAAEMVANRKEHRH
jgi:4-hydroxythreonine-4-phosphate dehydrogenase